MATPHPRARCAVRTAPSGVTVLLTASLPASARANHCAVFARSPGDIGSPASITARFTSLSFISSPHYSCADVSQLAHVQVTIRWRAPSDPVVWPPRSPPGRRHIAAPARRAVRPEAPPVALPPRCRRRVRPMLPKLFRGVPTVLRDRRVAGLGASGRETSIDTQPSTTQCPPARRPADGRGR